MSEPLSPPPDASSPPPTSAYEPLAPVHLAPLADLDGEIVFQFSLREHWPWMLTIVALFVLIWLLSPILAPFVVGGVFAYLGDPLADRLQRLRLSRGVSVALLFLVFLGVLVSAVVLIVPLLEDQVVMLINVVPNWLRWVQDVGLPRVGLHLPAGIRLDPEGLRRTLTDHWSQASDLARTVLGLVGESTPAVLRTAADLLMIPLVAYYLLRDWDHMAGWISDLVPRPLLPAVQKFGRETDAVLSSLIRGQVAVMASLALFYSGGLWLAGLDVALLVGSMAGLISFIPYLGFISGWIIASIAILVQTQSTLSLAAVAIVFGVGQVLESGVLTPMLVGDRIGLHPVAVIFAVLAGGQLFGFVGVLLALPVAAVIAVMLRHTRHRWLQSPLYLGKIKPRPAPPGSTS